MGWRSVIITQHAKMTYASQMMVVQTMDGVNQVPLDDIALVMVETSQAVLSSALLSKLLARNIKTIFVDQHHQPVGETIGYQPAAQDCDQLRQQFEWPAERKECLWTWIMRAKIKGQVQVAQIGGRDASALLGELDQLEFNDDSNREAVVARKYFPIVFGEGFTRAKEHCINAALNYGYSILLAEIDRIIVECGYLTELGIHHHSQGNHFNFGSDLMEPFRPVIDYWVAGQTFDELTPDVRWGLVDAINLEISYNHHKTILRTALDQYIRSCLAYLNGEQEEMEIEVELPNEVPSNALNGHV